MSPKTTLYNRRRATVAVLVAITIVAVVGFAALTVDVGYLYNVRGDLQRTVDSAALAGASAIVVSPGEVVTRAKSFGNLNDTAAGATDIKSNDVELGSWDPNTRVFTKLTGDDEAFADACRVTARLSEGTGNAVPLFFAGIFGKTNADVSASATAQFGTAEAWDVVIVQDKSGSFTDTLDLAKEADRSLVQCLKDHTDNASQLGFVTYTGSAQLTVPLQSLEFGFNQLMTAIDNLGPCCWWFCGSKLPCKTGTDIAAGLDVAINALQNSTSDPEIGKAIVIVSDGKPQSTAWAPVPDDAGLRAQAVASANAADAAGISVFSIYYAGTSATPDEDAVFLESLIRGGGTFHKTVDAGELSNLLWKVCASLPLMLVE